MSTVFTRICNPLRTVLTYPSYKASLIIQTWCPITRKSDIRLADPSIKYVLSPTLPTIPRNAVKSQLVVLVDITMLPNVLPFKSHTTQTLLISNNAHVTPCTPTKSARPDTQAIPYTTVTYQTRRARHTHRRRHT